MISRFRSTGLPICAYESVCPSGELGSAFRRNSQRDRYFCYASTPGQKFKHDIFCIGRNLGRMSYPCIIWLEARDRARLKGVAFCQYNSSRCCTHISVCTCVIVNSSRTSHLNLWDEERVIIEKYTQRGDDMMRYGQTSV